jgi:hypothetical protein
VELAVLGSVTASISSVNSVYICSPLLLLQDGRAMQELLQMLGAADAVPTEDYDLDIVL